MKKKNQVENNDPFYLKSLLGSDSDFYNFWFIRKTNLSSNLWNEIEEYVKHHFHYNDIQLKELKKFWDHERSLQMSILGSI